MKSNILDTFAKADPVVKLQANNVFTPRTINDTITQEVPTPISDAFGLDNKKRRTEVKLNSILGATVPEITRKRLLGVE